MDTSTPTMPSTDSTPSAPIAPATLSSPPSTALSIAQQLHTNTIDAAQASKLAKAGGFSPTHIAQALHVLREAGEAKAQAPAPERSEEQKTIDTHFPAAKPEDYLIPYFRPGEQATMTPELQRADPIIRNWLVDAGFSREAGNAFATTIARAEEQTKAMTPDQLTAYNRTELANLKRAHGEKLPERLKAVDDMLDELDERYPGLYESVLGAPGIGTNAMVWNLLLNHAPVYRNKKAR